ncbi:type II toxin-antitoxin system HipA family toxin [Dactylosporangium siamense]|uniref:Kinase Y4dM n=1 Tax=Dactylosporangium siamense TaxID=685454 RepID=A0A919UB24_9ACTN|nr:type II toxin-antitoxin system HipA family toxin [Dactylosporangium siamense]GIG44233.1 putative kinase Y4dM [Dactylosporangium siamense]
MATTAEVRLHGRRVGFLRFNKGRTEFVYEDDLDAPSHQTLGQIFEDDPRAVRRAFTGIPAWFANLLPEGALRKQIIREMGGGNVGDFTLLLRLGDYLPGAVSVHAESEPADDIGPEPPAETPEHPLRHSLAGVQLKFSISSDRMTSPASGDGGWWIVKLPDRTFRDLPANEYLTMRWLAATGFEVPAVDLVPATNVKGVAEGLADPNELLYVIERFDRTPAGRLHVEDFAQVADVEPLFKYGEPGQSYDGLAAVVAQLCGTDGYLDFIRRLAAMIVVGNTDAHLKNWALCYPDGRTPQLSPVYDFHSLTIYSQYRWQPLSLSINGQKAPGSITLDDFRGMAERIGEDPEKTARIVAETVERMRAAWTGELLEEARGRFDPLARHYAERLRSLSISTGVAG